MSTAQHSRHVELVPVDRITVLNPRARNKKIFREIVANIAAVGLKRPITVTRRDGPEGLHYDLVCGQGRLEAFQQLGQREIPAFVIEADQQACLVKSLVENCARRQHRAIDLVHDIGGMKERGYADADIARKTGLSLEYVKGVARLLSRGEQRLLRAVESGHIPVSVAVEIADANDEGVQEALHQAYEKNLLRGRKLIAAKRLVESRRRRGKGLSNNAKARPRMSSDALVKAYQEDTDRKRFLIRKADATRSRLIFIAHAMRELLHDDRFADLLKTEGLDSLPKKLAARMDRQELAR
ncbi:plasmid partitioning protein RepB C-terminal domain-containing protein [Afifella marina]|uniref:Chromosome partitioning protein, ParB family n=1 Tax=Afifella marina DSM 2698 TaxID=1120955 RepID=A0A1G5NBG6_AFIMA|nr:plasmid partitioning protein RepB C-terminal domain-containing protein [Afifella marina]MBK1623108.1 chromosome partitioning protein ParB [Afifella marina DSM 2698]MBK1626102.1 chromosome partitioning protein ParB [Afifella marina]MBK5916980.1 chromosome partitioning protein ParB [Afifella marina]RAI21982.1 chromosome partitioning protein ParB [Afifella marina DSM 2698]SCZ34121.1 chromosome partitioning protein, ParB family [Afifella marina DSM 2698]